MLDQVMQPLNRIRTVLDPTARPPRQVLVPDDLGVLEAGADYTDDGVLDYLWFNLDEEGRRYYKAVCLQVLTYLPRETHETMTVLEKMRKVLKGIYTAHVDFLYLVANIPGKPDSDDPALGIVQIYGVQALSDKGLEDAVAAAKLGLSAVRATMANFEQSRLEPISVRLGEWIRRAFSEMPMALTVIGHPDPRTAERGPGMSSLGGGQGSNASPTPMGLQQNEYLFRGMVAEGHEFLNVVLISRMGNGDQDDLFRLQERVAQEASLWASKEKFTRSISVGLGLPIMLSGMLGEGASSAYGASESRGIGESAGQTISRAHTEGSAEGESWGTAHTEGESWGTAETSGSSWSKTSGASTIVGIANGTSHTVGETHGTADTTGTAHTSGRSSGSGSSWGYAVANNQGASMTQGGSANLGLMGTGVGANASISESAGQTIARSSGGSSFSGSLSSTTNSKSHTDMHSTNVADGTSQVLSKSVAKMRSSTRGGFASHTTSHGTSVADTTSHSTSKSTSVADSTGIGFSAARSRGESIGLSRGQSLSRMQTLGLGAGVAPSISMSKTYMGEDHVATLVADALRGQEAQLRIMALEGGVYVDNYFLCSTPEGRASLEALIPVAYHGTEEVTTPVRPRRLAPAVEEYIRLHAMTFTPSNRPSRLPFVLEPWEDTTLLTLMQAATYVAPGAFEHGVTLTVQERVPPFAFYTNMPGEAILGHQYSVELGTAKPTNVPVKLSQDRMSNWAFAADTRMGKSVTAERLCFEAVTQWDFRVIVADFGAGWRKLVNALPRDLVDIWGLSPSSPRPIRWNPLQIGRRILAEEQMTATVELLCNAGRMGERQQGFMLETLERLYINNGVLTHIPAVQGHAKWGQVQDDERQILADEGITLPAGPVALANLGDEALQALAVHRSKAVDMTVWYNALHRLKGSFRDGSPSRNAIEGVLLRLRHLTKGRMGSMYGAGEGSVAIEDLALPHGLCVLEGGARMSEYAKAALLSLMSWHLYTDAVARREEGLEGVKHAPMVLMLEEGNKIISGVQSGASEGQRVQSDIIPAMFRDAGKYLIFLSIIVQSPSELPPGIISSCNNIAVGQLKNGKDVQEVMSSLGRSPVGFVDTHYARYINRMPQGQFILKLGLSMNVADTEPLLFRPLMVRAKEPDREQLRRRSRRVN